MQRPVAFSILAVCQSILGLVAIVGPFIGAIPNFYPAWASAWYICTGVLYIVSAVLLWRLSKWAFALTALGFFGTLALALLLSPEYSHFSVSEILRWLAVGAVYAIVVFVYRARLS